MLEFLTKWLCGGKQREINRLLDSIQDLRAEITRIAGKQQFFFTEEPKLLSGARLRSELTQLFPSAEIKLADVGYKYVSLGEIKRFILWDTDNELSYRVDVFDCNNYALQLMAHFKFVDAHKLGNGSFGIAWGPTPMGYHAFNIAYADGKILFIEPQTDELWSFEDNKINGKNYMVDFIMM